MSHARGTLSSLWHFIIHPAVLTIIAIIVSIVVGWYFYDKGKSAAVAEAVEAGRQQGYQAGEASAYSAFEANIDKYIEKRHPGALKRERDLGFLEGKEAGRKEGKELGYKDGFADGKETAQTEHYERGKAEGIILGREQGYEAGYEAGTSDGFDDGYEQARGDYTLQRHAENNWQIYEEAVIRLAAWADKLEETKGDDELQAQVRSEARALVDSAFQLQISYRQQAASFNSIIDDINDALNANNFPQLRENARALRSTLEIKRANFLQANQDVSQALEKLLR